MIIVEPREKRNLRASIDHLAMYLVCVAPIVAKRAKNLCNIFGEGDGVRLSIVPCLDGGQNFSILLNQRGELEHKITAICRREVSPRRILEGGPGCFYCGVDIVLRRSVN
jgi:hypothetical protein